MALLYLLHQDFWFWRDARPLVFGFLPIGLFYHAVFTVASSLVLWLLVKLAWPAQLEGGRMIPALVVFAYLAIVLYIGIFAFRTLDTTRTTPKTIFSRAGRWARGVSAVVVRHEHDRLLHSWRVRTRVRQRHRHLRPDGVFVGAVIPLCTVRHRHAALGARQASRLHDAGADVPRPLGMPPHRHGHFRASRRCCWCPTSSSR